MVEMTGGEEMQARRHVLADVLIGPEDIPAVFELRQAIFGDKKEIKDISADLITVTLETYRFAETFQTVPHSMYNWNGIQRRSLLLANSAKVFDAFSDQVVVLGHIVTGAPINQEKLDSWVNPPVRRIAGLFRKQPQGIQQWIEGQDKSPLELYDHSKRVFLQMTEVIETLYATTGMAILDTLVENEVYDRFNLDTLLTRWAQQLTLLADDPDLFPEQRLREKQKLFKAIRSKLRYVSVSAKVPKPLTESEYLVRQRDQGAKLAGFESPKHVNESYHFHGFLQAFSKEFDAWIEMRDTTTQFMGLLTDYMSPDDKTHSGEVDEDLSETPATDGVENVPRNYGEVYAHLADLQAGYSRLVEDWQPTKGDLKATGLTELSRRFVAGGQGKEWTLPGMPKDQAWQLLGVLQHCAELLQHGQLFAEANLQYDIGIEKVILSDYAAVTTWLEGQQIILPEGLPTRPPQAVISSNIAKLTSDWQNIQLAILDHWPAINRPHINQLEELLFSEARFGGERPGNIPNEVIIVDEPVEEEPEPEEVEDILTGGTDIGFDPELAAIAKQLDWVVLPPMPFKDLREFITGLYHEQQLSFVDWRRLKDLTRLQEAFSGNLYRSKHGALGTTTPYFVLTFDTAGRSFAIAENPLYGNATYIVREDLAAGTWQEVLAEYKKDARKFGAHQIIHTTPENHFRRVQTALQDLSTVKKHQSV